MKKSKEKIVDEYFNAVFCDLCGEKMTEEEISESEHQLDGGQFFCKPHLELSKDERDELRSQWSE